MPAPAHHKGRCLIYLPVEPADGAIIPALRRLLDAPEPGGGLTLELLDAALADVPLNARRPPTEVALDRYRRARANTAHELDIYGTAEERRWVLWTLDGLINGRTANADEGQRYLEIDAVVRARELGLAPKTCSCCGDHHMDVGVPPLEHRTARPQLHVASIAAAERHAELRDGLDVARHAEPGAVRDHHRGPESGGELDAVRWTEHRHQEASRSTQFPAIRWYTRGADGSDVSNQKSPSSTPEAGSVGWVNRPAGGSPGRVTSWRIFSLKVTVELVPKSPVRSTTSQSP